MDEFELKPCPFCGGKAILKKEGYGYSITAFTESYTIKYEKCKATLRKIYDAEFYRDIEDGKFKFKGTDGLMEAINDWNKRSN